jgi:hypothetical protein
MLLVAFTDDELQKISAESPLFADKLEKMASNAAGLPVFATVSVTQRKEAIDYFQTIYPKYGLQTCVKLIREWASHRGIQRYASLAGAKRLAIDLAHPAE